MKRPWCCPEHSCAPLFQVKDSHIDLTVCKSGKTFFCYGRMIKAITFIYDGEKHANDLSTCFYTPLKGVIRFQMNEDDWEWMKIGAEHALEKLHDT